MYSHGAVTSAIRNLWLELCADAMSEKTVPAMAAGITSGLGLLVAQVAFGSFIFSGALAPYASQGVGLVLFGNFAACLLVAMAGGYRGSIAGLSPALVIVMATMASTTDAAGEVLFLTVAALLVASAVATGLCCLMIGHFRLANLVRFIPYPVAAGFVAGIGGSVCLAAMTLMGANVDVQSVLANLEPAVLWTWLPGTAYGIALYAAMKRWGNALFLPASVVVAVAGYHLALDAIGITGDEARIMGLLLTSTADGGLWPSLFPADLARVEWTVMAGQIPNMLTLMFIAFICVVMNVAGLELAVNRELDWNREFRATGLASIVAGVGGGTVATLIVPASLRSKLFNATTRLTGVVAAAVIGIALFFGDGLLEFVPTALIGGILVFAGLGMLDEGLAKSRKCLPREEFGIVLVIFVIILVFGLIEGVGAGMLATLVFFAVRLSRVDPVESRFTARKRHSNKARSIPDRAILLQEGGRALAFRFRGYIFFGSADSLIDNLRKTLEAHSRPYCLMLDFAAVSGIDFSAVSALSRFLRVASKAGVKVVLSAASRQLRSGLEHTLPASLISELVFEPNADRGLERCEEIVIAAWRMNAANGDDRRAALLGYAAADLERHLARQILFEDLMEELRDWLAVRDYAAGGVLMGADAPEEGLQFLLAGRASAYDDTGRRLCQYSPGDAIWSAAASGGRVIADDSCQTMELTSVSRRWLEANEEQLALKLYRYLLADRFETKTDDRRAPDEAGEERDQE